MILSWEILEFNCANSYREPAPSKKEKKKKTGGFKGRV